MKIKDLFKRKSEVYPFSTYVMANSGVTVDAKKNPTVIACLNLVSSAIANMPLDIYKGKEKAKDHYLYPLLHNEPNSDETIDMFMKMLVKDYYDGNIYIYIYRDENGIPASLFRLDPAKVSVTRGIDNKKIFSINNQHYDYTSILHIPSSIGYDGIVGKSIYSYAADTFTLVKKIEDYIVYGMTNSLGKRLVIDISQAFPNATKEQIDDLKAKYISTYTGVENSEMPLFKANKIDYSSIDSGQNDNRAAQMVELRAYQDNEICRLFGVPSNFISPDKYQSEIENIYTLFVDNAVKPIATAIEQGLRKILYPAERNVYEIAFNYNAILKTKLADRIDSYTKQLAAGILSLNEVRAKDNLPPIQGGDRFTVAGGNWMNIETGALITSAQPVIEEKQDEAI